MKSDLLSLVQIVKKLRSPNGCDWDKEQTHESLTPYLLEETYEVIDAIETNSLDYTTSNIMDYADKINGTHIVMGMQGRLLWGNAFIKARYTLADIKNSTGFSDVSVGFAFGL